MTPLGTTPRDTALPPDVELALQLYCRAHGEERADVLSDAVALFLDQCEADEARQ